jgi:transposase
MALHEIAERLAAESRVSACPATVWRFSDKRGITFKKNGARGGTRTRRRGAPAPLLA